MMEDNVSLSVGASERLVRRWCTDEECDLSRGVNVLNFFDSVAMRTLPEAASLTGR